MMTKFIIVDNNGQKFSHFPDLTGNYATLCALDGDDPNPSVNQSISGYANRVNCPDCIALFDAVKKYSERDLDRGSR